MRSRSASRRSRPALGLLVVYAALLLQLPDVHVTTAETLDACPCPPADCQCPRPPVGEGSCLTAVACHGQGPLQVLQVSVFPEHMGPSAIGTAAAEAAAPTPLWGDPTATSIHIGLPDKVPR